MVKSFKTILDLNIDNISDESEIKMVLFEFDFLSEMIKN